MQATRKTCIKLPSACGLTHQQIKQQLEIIYYFQKRLFDRISQGRYEKALEALQHAVEHVSGDWNIFYDTALCHFKLKQLAQCEENCKEAAKLGRHKCVYKLLSTSLVKQGKFDEALQVYRLALR